MRVPTIAALLLIAQTSIHADALTDLRAALSRLTATAPAHGSFEVSSTSTENEGERPVEGKATVGFEINDAGLRLAYPKTTLMQANQEARAKEADPERPSPVRGGMERIHALQLADLVDAASMLSIQLLDAQLIEEKPATLRGKPAKVIALKLTPKLSKSEAKHVKKVDATLSVWIGDDGVPLAAQREFSVKVSFMLMSFESKQSEHWDYERVGDRLVAVRHEQTENAGGFGEHSTSRTVEAVRLEP